MDCVSGVVVGGSLPLFIWVFAFTFFALDMIFTYRFMKKTKKAGVKEYWKFEMNWIVSHFVKYFGPKGVLLSTPLTATAFFYILKQVDRGALPVGVLWFLAGAYMIILSVHVQNIQVINKHDKSEA